MTLWFHKDYVKTKKCRRCREIHIPTEETEEYHKTCTKDYKEKYNKKYYEKKKKEQKGK